MSDKRFIYGLYDPRRPDVVMVVGKTKRGLRWRCLQYVGEARLKARRGEALRPSLKWVLKLLGDGVRPCIRLLKTTTAVNWQRDERNAIAKYRGLNTGLLNTRCGGNGSDEGTPKLICEKHRCRRKPRRTSGILFCRRCEMEYARSPKVKAYRRTDAYRKRTRELRRQPKYRAYDNAYSVKWVRTPKGHAWRNSYIQSRKYKTWRAEYGRRPETIRRMRAYEQLPKMKAYKRAYARSAAGKASGLKWKHSHNGRVYLSAYWRQPKQLLYARDLQYARKRGMSVPEFRKTKEYKILLRDRAAAKKAGVHIRVYLNEKARSARGDVTRYWHYREYNRDFYHARKLGLSVAEYRARQK